MAPISGVIISFSSEQFFDNVGSVKNLNTIGYKVTHDEDCSKALQSDYGKKLTDQTQQKTTIPENIKERLREKIRRKSHSIKSQGSFDVATKSFEKFLTSRQMEYEESLARPIQVMDEFVAWLDENMMSPRTIENYVMFVKKTLKFSGAKIDQEEFRDQVTLPKIRPFQDDKVTRDQIRRIILGLKHLQSKAVLMLMKDTQARPAEILGLKVCDFNVSYDPPYLNIPAERAKNDLPRELFFTPETKEILVSRIKRANRMSSDFVFIKVTDPQDEEEIQRKISGAVTQLSRFFRMLMNKPEFEDMRERVQQRGVISRYKIHPYSFKKFAFTTMADTLGEIATRAIKGDREYVFTYYRKNREERAADYRRVMPKLCVFSSGDIKNAKEEIEEEVRTMSPEELARLQEFLRNCKNQASK